MVKPKSAILEDRVMQRSKRRVYSSVVEDAPLAKKRRRKAYAQRWWTEGTGDPVGIVFIPPKDAKTDIVLLSRDLRVATCPKGYRMLRATGGVHTGSWYFEFQVLPQQLPKAAQVAANPRTEGPAYRLGWANECGFIDGPVGFDQHSYAYRSKEGSRVHQSTLAGYGQSYGAGDTVGCMISFTAPAEEVAAAEARDEGVSAGPADGERQAAARALVESGAGRRAVESVLLGPHPPRRPVWAAHPPPAASGEQAASSSSSSSFSVSGSAVSGGSRPPVGPPNTKSTVNHRLWGSTIRFFLNGVDQGVAFVHLTRETRYYPAASMYGGGTVMLNPGPSFAHPPSPTAFPPGTYKPICEAVAQPDEGGSGVAGVGGGGGAGVGGAGGPGGAGGAGGVGHSRDTLKQQREVVVAATAFKFAKVDEKGKASSTTLSSRLAAFGARKGKK